MGAISAKSLREKTSQELRDQLLLEKKRLFDGIVKSSTGESIKPHEKREGKRLLARIQSVLRERELRESLTKRITELTPKAKGAKPLFAKLLKSVEERADAIRKELAKPADQRRVKPILKRVRMKHLGGKQDPTQADRSALYLAEASRLKVCLERDDMGDGK